MRGFVPARRGPFAEAKGPRLQGRNPASNNFPGDPSLKPIFVKEKANLDSRLKLSGMTRWSCPRSISQSFFPIWF